MFLVWFIKRAWAACAHTSPLFGGVLADVADIRSLSPLALGIGMLPGLFLKICHWEIGIKVSVTG